MFHSSSVVLAGVRISIIVDVPERRLYLEFEEPDVSIWLWRPSRADSNREDTIWIEFPDWVDLSPLIDEGENEVMLQLSVVKATGDDGGQNYRFYFTDSIEKLIGLMRKTELFIPVEGVVKMPPRGKR